MTVSQGSQTVGDDDSGINLALLKVLPAARRILELGCNAGQLGRRYKRVHPGASWTGVDISDEAVTAARPHLDNVVRLDLDVDPIRAAGTGFDLVVLGDVLEHLKRPQDVLADLRTVCTGDAVLVCCVPNMSHLSVIERLLRGDIMYDRNGLLDETHLRFLAPRSAFKMLLDAGWLPHGAGGYQQAHANERFAEAMVRAAQALDIPQTSAELNVQTYQLIVRCARRPMFAPGPKPRATVTVIVVGNDRAVLDLNVLRSPGLAEIGAEIRVSRDGGSVAATYAAEAARASGEWLLLCTEDVYFPSGTGHELLAVLDAIDPSVAADTLLGFAGLGIGESLEPFRAGLVVDRRALRDFPATERAISIADFALVLHRDNRFDIDAALGRQLWATDLCLQSMYGPAARFAHVTRIPVFHNSVDDGAPNTDYERSVELLAAKYPFLDTIPVWRTFTDPPRFRNFSCSYPRLYADGGFYESPATAHAFVEVDACRWVANVYAPYGYDRPPPARFFGRNTAFTARLLDQTRDWNAEYRRGASTDTFLLDEGLLFNRCLYKAVNDEIVQMYETNRPDDRYWRRELDIKLDLQQIRQPHDASTDFFYLGSIGAENYGHWLIDDLARAKALLAHFPADRLPTVVLNSYNPLMDSIREESLRLLTAGLAEIDVIFISYARAHYFPRLYYVSPSSYNPFLKCPEAAMFLREHFVAQAARAPSGSANRTPNGGTELFVTRRATWRNLVNLAEVIEYFRERSFDVVELEGMSFAEQVQVFSRARIVVGVMGAGMTNTVFSPAGAQVVHLAPDGWEDPFYWDLAAVKGQRYAVAFGEPLKPDTPATSDFSIARSDLDAIWEWL